ncbi:hypothetical protein scyTo_0023790 [Scyliorhinus torazame]|uniref:Uncharacterized protein n=1 Tax=Scyliorhinus torazame TaxID=75743 RepID=A0A401QBS3_SCYTO|nr:hypothetical protein [Scyliorhinus torazame]
MNPVKVPPSLPAFSLTSGFTDDAPTYSDVIEAGFQNMLKLKEMREKLLPQKPKSFFPSRRPRGPQSGSYLDRELMSSKGGERQRREKAAVSSRQGSSEEWLQQEGAAAETTVSHNLLVMEEEDVSHREVSVGVCEVECV